VARRGGELAGGAESPRGDLSAGLNRWVWGDAGLTLLLLRSPPGAVSEPALAGKKPEKFKSCVSR